jgi:4-amino-4-deoxy-L-arabinose transferase-like glycosyltransferase
VTEAPERALKPDAAARTALALIVIFALARLALTAMVGLGVDEAYTIAVSRRLDLSYFDHPPLHQWITHYTALAFGEGAAMRLPFVAMFAATGWLTFALTRRLFGGRAGLVALFALNVSAFFLVYAGGRVTPDGPLLLALAGAALVLAKLFFDAPSPRAAWGLWLAAGLWLGFAGLSKYSALLFVVGLVAFLALSPRQRHWFAHPAPYLAALLALAMVSPVFIWNWRHGWVSLTFEGGRGAIAGSWRPAQLGAMLLGEIALLTPWIFIPLAGALVAGARKAFEDEKRLFLVCLALPPILVFTLTPLWGASGLPHWPMPGWFFAFPLMGAWLGEPWGERYDLKRWAIISAGLSGAVTILVASQAATGWLTRFVPLPAGAIDPTLETLDWGALRAAPALRDEAAFVVTTKWLEGGKIALALGPRTPVLGFSSGSRGMAFPDYSARFVGQDGVIVVPQNRLDQTLAQFRPYFSSFDPPQSVVLRRGGRDAISLAVVPAHGLTRAFPVPYPH